jgi:ketosteroid isomerase-like protein
MADRNVEILRRAYEASQIDGAEGVEAVPSSCSDDVVWVSDPLIEEITDLGDRALGITTFRGSPPNGPEVEWVWCHLVTVRDGLITEARSFMDRESARRAVDELD